MCVFTLLAERLQSGDLVIEASEKFSDYRDQFVSDEEFHHDPYYNLNSAVEISNQSLVFPLRNVSYS
jgi:hypothetical protein